MRPFGLALILSLMLPAAAQAFERVTDPNSFAQIVVGREISRTGIRLTVLPDGRIEGRALGLAVTGDWRWLDGFFCRSMEWSNQEIPYNCMVVLANDRSVRFIADQGTGQYADFRVR